MRILKLLSLFILICLPCEAAVNFNGTTSVIASSATDNIMTETGALTISAWVYPRSVGENNGGRIVDRGTLTVSGVILFVAATNAIEFFSNGGVNLVRLSSNNVLSLNTWQHILVTWDGSTTAANVHIYKNGVEVSYQTTTNGNALIDNSVTTLRIGDDSTSARTFDGYISEVAIWDSVLTSTDIKKLSVSVRRMPFNVSIAPKRYFRLDDCTSGDNCTYRDRSGLSGNNGTGTDTLVVGDFISNP